MTEWLGLPALGAAHGAQIDNLIGWIHIFMLILFVGWGGFFAYALVRFRQSRNPVANYTGVRSHASNYLEAGVLVVELVLLFAFSIPLWAARVDHVPSESEAVVVQLTGEQFAWNVRYAGPDGVGTLDRSADRILVGDVRFDHAPLADLPERLDVMRGAWLAAGHADANAGPKQLLADVAADESASAENGHEPVIAVGHGRRH